MQPSPIDGPPQPGPEERGLRAGRHLGQPESLYLRRFVFSLLDAGHHTEDWTFVLQDGQELRAHFDLRRVVRSVSVPPGK